MANLSSPTQRESLETGLLTKNAGKCMKRLVCADIGIVLIQDGETISEENCPPWLDLSIISSVG